MPVHVHNTGNKIGLRIRVVQYSVQCSPASDHLPYTLQQKSRIK